jgi:hypothetical protein
MKFPLEVTQEILKQLEGVYNEIKKYAPCFKGAKPAKGSKPNFGTKLDQDGDIVFKFSTRAEGKNPKTGETWKKTIPVFDVNGKHLEVNIGNGSTGKVSYEIGPKFVDGTKYGLNLYLIAAQVLNLVEYTPGTVSAEAFGFDVAEGGFPGEEENPFDDPENEFASPGDVSEDF